MMLWAVEYVRRDALAHWCAARAGVLIMALQEYVRSIGRADTVSKEQVFRFLEMQFARADRNHDGLLDMQELDLFAQSVSCPESDQR
jgi:hypothetical protein